MDTSSPLTQLHPSLNWRSLPAQAALLLLLRAVVQHRDALVVAGSLQPHDQRACDGQNDVREDVPPVYVESA